MGVFADVNWVFEGTEVVYKCQHCGKKLATVTIDYFRRNHTVATEDYPLQLRKEHYSQDCPEINNKINNYLAMVKEHGGEATKKEILEMLSSVC